MQLLIVNTDAKPAPRLSANRPENAKGLRPKRFQELILQVVKRSLKAQKRSRHFS